MSLVLYLITLLNFSQYKNSILDLVN